MGRIDIPLVPWEETDKVPLLQGLIFQSLK
jgi:hypothetical protein